MKTLKILIFAVLALSMGMACSDFVTPQEPDNSDEQDLLKSKLLGEWVLSDQKDSYIYTFADNDTVYTKTPEGKTIEKWPYQPITADSIRIVRNNWTTHNKVVFYSNDSIRINDFLPTIVAVYPPMFGDAVLKRYLGNPDENGLNAQTEFAPIGAEWYYNCCAGGNIADSHLNYIVVEKDTSFEGNDCRVLSQYYDKSTIASEKYIIKQEQGRVYYYCQDRFNLLFDFDAKVNDIVEFTFVYKRDEADFSLCKDTILSARYRIESITANAQNLRTFATKILEEDKFAVYGMEILPWHYSYTEKIGFYSAFMPVLDNRPYPAVDNFPMLRYYFEAGFSFVSDEWAATSLPRDYPVDKGN